jgi:hypothetical protein
MAKRAPGDRSPQYLAQATTNATDSTPQTYLNHQQFDRGLQKYRDILSAAGFTVTDSPWMAGALRATLLQVDDT